MSDLTAGESKFLRKAIKALADELDEKTRDKLRALANGKSLREQMAMMVEESMKGWKQPDYFPVRQEKVKERSRNVTGERE